MPRSALRIELRVRESRAARAWLVAAHIPPLAALAWLPGWVAAIAVAFLAVNLHGAWRGQRFPGRRDGLRALRYAAGAWSAGLDGGRNLPLSLIRPPWVTPGFISFEFRDARGQLHPLLLCADAVAPEPFRRLRVRLRTEPPAPARWAARLAAIPGGPG